MDTSIAAKRVTVVNQDSETARNESVFVFNDERVKTDLCNKKLLEVTKNNKAG